MINGISFGMATSTPDVLPYVDPYIGTGGHGHTFLGSSVPFGAIQPGPDNFNQGWDWCSGYHYSSNVLKGFSHLHLSGTGMSDLGDILIMPFTGEVVTSEGSNDDTKGHYSCSYSHAREVARPSYYSVVLDDYNIKAELTASERVAMHRYRFPKDEVRRFILDLHTSNTSKARKTLLKRVDDNTYVGYRHSGGWAKDQRVFFALSFNSKMKDLQLFHGNKPVKGTAVEGHAAKGVFSFAPSAEPLLLKVALSPVSTANALANLKAEIPHWNFQKVVDESNEKWRHELSKVMIKSDSQKIKRIFYTAMYHSMIAPTLFNDHNKDYRGTDKKVRENADFDNYTIFSLWDTYRTQHPWMTITQPERVDDMMNSMLAIHQQQGSLPVWHLMGCETDTMVGYHAVPPLVDAYLKGFVGFDPDLAYEAMKSTAMQKDYRGLGHLMEKGYIPCDKEGESVAKALEYAIDDACIAMVAKALGKDEDAKYFEKRSKSYAKYFDKDSQFMRGRLANGEWRSELNPMSSSHRKDDYCEGNAWQYTWLVPHDPMGLVELFGSEEAFVKKLDQLFVLNDHKNLGASPDISGLIGQYAHGNEPSHHISYLYAYVGQQWKSASRVREIMKTMYSDDFDGLCGNEDCGQMSAWYLMSALGFYPVHPADGVYVLGSPVVKASTIRLPGDKLFKVKALNNSSENVYIQSVTYNGSPYTKSYITHDMVMNGGELCLTMGHKPNKKFGVLKADRPTSGLVH